MTSKNIPDVNAVHEQEFFDLLLKDGNLLLKARDQFISDISNAVNPQVCLNPNQVASVRGMIVGSTHKERSLFNALQTAAIINSFRNDCENCINTSCKIRSQQD